MSSVILIATIAAIFWVLGNALVNTFRSVFLLNWLAVRLAIFAIPPLKSRFSELNIVSGTVICVHDYQKHLHGFY